MTPTGPSAGGTLRQAPCSPGPRIGRRWCRLGHLIALLGVLLASMPTAGRAAPLVMASPATDAPTIGGVQLEMTTAAGWPVYYDPEVPPSAVQNVAAAIELAIAEIPRVTGLPAPSGTVTTYLLADRDRFRLAVAEHRGSLVDQVSDKANGFAMWRGGQMRMFLKMPEIRSPAGAAGFAAHELAHLTMAEVAGFRPLTQWLNEGYAELVRHAVVQADFPDAAEALARLHRVGLASGLRHNGGPLPWPELVTSARFSSWTRAGYGQMAYGQSALMVQLFLDRYGAASVPDVFRAIGRGASPTAAFGEVFGPFAPLGEAFDAAIADLPAQVPPGLHQLAPRPRADGVPSLAIVAGEPGEPAIVEVYAGGTLVDRQELTLDPVGFSRVAFGDAVGPGAVVVRVATPSLGLLEIPLVIEPAARFRHNTAPAQIPRAGGVTTPPALHLERPPAA